MKSSFWPNLGLSVAVGNVAAGGHIDILEPDAVRAAARRHGAPRHCPASRCRSSSVSGTWLTIATPWCICWPWSDVMVIAERAGTGPSGKTPSFDLGFLQAQDVGRFLAQESLDDADAGADRLMFQEAILSVSCGGSIVRARRRAASLCAVRPRRTSEKAPAPGAWSEGRPSVRHARNEGAGSPSRATGGKSRTERPRLRTHPDSVAYLSPG